MRIYLSCQQSPHRHAVPAYSFWRHYFAMGLTEAGHEVVETSDIDWAEGLLPLDSEERRRWLERTWSATLTHLRAEHARKPIDLFLGYLFPHQVEVTAVATIRKLGVPCVNFFCDNVREFTTAPREYAGFDLHWVPEHGALALYRAAGLPHLHAPMPMWVSPEYRTPPTQENNDIAFLGSHDLLREDLLGAAVERGLPLRITGAGWIPDNPITDPRRALARTLANQVAFLRNEGIRGLLMRATYQLHRRRPTGWIASHCTREIGKEDYFRVIRESQVVLGINRYPSFRHTFNRPGRYSRLRDIEAPMLGACYLTEYAPGLEDLYDLGTEILTYRTVEELVDQAMLLRANPARRRSLRERGQRRALSSHTVKRTLERIAAILRLPA